MLIINDLHSIRLRGSASVFSSLLPNVIHGRNLYCDQLDSLPKEFQEFAKQHYRRRVSRAVDHVLIGEFLPWMITEWFGCKKTTSLKNVSGNWLLLYFGIMLLDDTLDDPEFSDRDKAIIVSSLLQQQGICGLITEARNQKRLRETIDRSFRDTALAACSELRKKDESLGNFSEVQIVLSGKKLSFARICVDAIADQLEAPEARILALNNVLDNLLSALQLLDDLTDWAEDRSPRRATMPLVLRENRLSRNNLTEMKDKEFLCSLIITGALEDTLKEVLLLLSRCQSQSEAWIDDNNGWWIQYLNCLHKVVHAVHDEISNARVAIKSAAPQILNSDQLTDIQQAILEKMVARVQKQLRIVAQSS